MLIQKVPLTDTISRVFIFTQDFKQHKHLEFFWYPPYLKDPRPIFAHVLDSHYSTPVILGITVEVSLALFVWVVLCPQRSLFAFTDFRRRLLHLWTPVRSVQHGT